MAVTTTALLAYAAVASSLAGAGIAAYGQSQQAKVAKQTGDYNAKLAENQAIQDELEARENARRTRERNLQFAGEQRANVAAAGVTEEGSPLELLAYSAGKMELAVQDEARASEARLRLGFNTATSIRNAATATANAYKTQTFGTILSGVAGAAGQYGQAKYTGAIK